MHPFHTQPLRVLRIYLNVTNIGSYLFLHVILPHITPEGVRDSLKRHQEYQYQVSNLQNDGFDTIISRFRFLNFTLSNPLPQECWETGSLASP